MTDDEKVALVLTELTKSEDERLIALGKAMFVAGLGANESGNNENPKVVGARLIDKLLAKTKRQICGSTIIRSSYEKSSGVDAGIILPLLDIVATVLSGPAVFTATAAILSRGIGKLCESDW